MSWYLTNLLKNVHYCLDFLIKHFEIIITRIQKLSIEMPIIIVEKKLIRCILELLKVEYTKETENIQRLKIR